MDAWEAKVGGVRRDPDLEEMAEQARVMRAHGLSLRQIGELVGAVGKTWLNQALAGTEPATWTRRPNAKDDVKEQARELRRAGATLTAIAQKLGVSKSSVSLWCRDLRREPPPDWSLRTSEMHRRRWAPILERLEDERQQRRSSSAQFVGGMSDRELLLLGAVAYWCEGAKSKPWRRSERVVFINSDPLLVRLFVAWTDLLQVDRSRLKPRVHIHESADVDAAEAYWAGLLDIDRGQLGKAVIKRHNPKTVRKNVGDDYRGCLSIDVARSKELYQQIEGLMSGIHSALLAALPSRSRMV